jgi:hypothetical protein
VEHRLALSILALTLLAVGAALILPSGREAEPEPRLPWAVQAHPDGSATVFGLTLGQSTLADAERVVGEEAEVTLFASPDGDLALEAYLEQVVLNGLRASMVLTLDLPADRLRQAYDRGTRTSRLGSGATKVTPSPRDRAAAQDAPVRHLTYLPAADLAPEVLEARFGAPAERIPAPDEVVHWLYPDLGLDIAVHPERGEVLQYVMPREFERLVRSPLRSAGSPAPGG